MIRTDRWAWPYRRLLWIDIAWAIFALLNLAAIYFWGTWETVPFHFIWVSLTILYGFRVWRMQPTLVLLAAIIVTTGTLLFIDYRRGLQPLDELTEVPLMSAMFIVMVWHVQRRLAVERKMRAVSETNLRLLERERRFIQNASHELRTPITVAIGHAELLQRASDPSRMAADARIVVQELMRLRRLSDRLLLLAAAEDPDFLHKKPIEVEPLLVEALNRWSPTPRRWRLGVTDEAIVEADGDRLALAIDALLENAVKHTSVDDSIELSVRRGKAVEIAVADSGTGIAAHELERITERFGRSEDSRKRGVDGLGLGLAIVKAVAEAHGGRLLVRSQLEHGSEFIISLPESTAMPSLPTAMAVGEATVKGLSPRPPGG